MTELATEWGWLGYLGAFVWAFFEGESFVLVAAALGRATGYVNPYWLGMAVWLGSFAGDQLYFYLGRRWGRTLLGRFPKAESKMERALLLLRKHEIVFVIMFRFWYGIRNVASAACGMSGMPWPRFAALNFIGAGVWATTFVVAGWFLGELLGPDGVLWLLFGFGVCLLLGVLWRAWGAREGRRAPP